MTPPDTIALESIDLGERGRTTYNRIEELAQSIRDNGLVQPIVLVPLNEEVKFVKTDECKTEDEFAIVGKGNWRFGLDAGGRRFQALKSAGYTHLYHATTSDPDRPGYVIKGEDQATPLARLFTEIAENLDRDDLDWRDEMNLLTKAWRLSSTEAYAKGEEILMRDFGAMLGVGYSNLQAAVAIHDDVIANPTRYKDCTG